MRWVLMCSAALTVLTASSAQAGDKVLVAPTPAWVAPAPPLDFAALSQQKDALPQFDEQVRVEGDNVTAYMDVASVIASPEILAKQGTLSINWQPAHGDLTYHRIEILRGTQVIDALQGGAGVTVLRREAGLEQLIVDGQLTAVKHIEGLRVGDIIHVAFSISQRDALLNGNVQDGLVLLPAPAKIGFGRARLLWETGRPLASKIGLPNVTATPKPLDGKWSELVVPLPVPKLPEMPQNMPSRFQPLPLLQFSSFPSWSSVSSTMLPLFAAKGLIPAGSDLAQRVDAIAAKSADPVRRMADALRMVQDDVRYQLVTLGSGNYKPQSPTETWDKRYGDCKAKTLLLLAALDRLGIEAEPVLANLGRGDGVAQMLPSAQAFNHIFVHARAGGEDFWLDGTMLGSRLADIRDVPRFGKVLPLRAQDAALIDLPLRAHARPDLDVDLAYDMTGGPHLPAPFTLTLRYAGQLAATSRVDEGGAYEEKLTAFAEKAAKTWVDTETIGKPQARYDAENAVWTLTVDGVAYPDWEFRDGHYALPKAPTLRVIYEAPRDRSAWRTIPAVIAQPWTAHSRVTVKLPNGGQGVTLTGSRDAELLLPAVEWRRSVALNGSELVEEITSKETGAEIAADKTSSTSKAIGDAMGKAARVELAANYPKRWDEVVRMRKAPAIARVRAVFDARVAAKPDEAWRLADRGWFAERMLDYAAAEADYTKAIALDPAARRYVTRGELRAQRGDHVGALADAKAAYEADEGNEGARNLYISELAQAGKVDQALDLLPGEPDLGTDQGLGDYLQRVYVLELGDRHGEAIGLLDAALEKRGSSAELRNSRCWYQALRNTNLDLALDDCNRAIELASNPSAYLDSRALVHFRAGNLALAKADYDAALAAVPDQASSLFMSGLVHAKLGEKAQAESDARAARALSPDIERFYGRFGIKP